MRFESIINECKSQTSCNVRRSFCLIFSGRLFPFPARLRRLVPLTSRKDEERRRFVRGIGDNLFRDMNIPRRPRNLFPVIRGSITAGAWWHKFS